MLSEAVDIEKLKESLAILKPNGQLFEIRILQGKQIISGYFTDVNKLEKELHKVSLKGANVFYTLNQIDESCYSREQHDCFRQSKTTTSDADIVGYNWMLVDLDPVRRPGISSTRDELMAAYDRGKQIAEYLREMSFPAPVMACSGNGIHLLYAIALMNNKENERLIENCLKALAILFNDDMVEVDTSVYNPARISKLYGTKAQKGSSTGSRPHRMSRIISVPPSKEIVKRELLEHLADEYPQELTKPVSSDHSFDVEEWLNRYGLRVNKTSEWKGVTKYVLEECPFDGSHKAPDSAVIKMASGAICFKCFHNSCGGHDWRELRLKYEPDAYDNKHAEDDARIDDGWKQYKAYNRQRSDIIYQEHEADEKHPEKMFETAADILNKPVEERICIKTGLKQFDDKTGGLAKGEITLVSGLRGSAKSTWLSQVALNAINQSFNVVFYSGELKDKRFLAWMLQQAAGPAHVKQHEKFEGFYYCQDDVKPKISEWMGQRFMLYNNDFGNNFKQLATSLREIIQRLQSDLVIIDNMSILDLSDITEDRRSDKWDQQKLFVETLKNLAMLCNCHIVFVAHPRKAAGFLRLDDVGGSGSLGNLVDNALIVHRQNDDFYRGFRRDIVGVPDSTRNKDEDSSYFSYRIFKDAFADPGDNCIEVVKERETGIQDLFIPLWYETETKRLKNGKYDDPIVYNWDTDGYLGPKDDNPFD